MTWILRTSHGTRVAAAAMIFAIISSLAVRAENPTFTVTPEALKPEPATGVIRVHVDPANISAQSPQADDPPVVGLRDVAVELAKWYRDGEAAGHHGDLYDNRDRGHSSMNLSQFPQFTKIVYNPPLRQKNVDYGVQFRLLYDRVVLGNSSTAMTQGPMWRSNPRMGYVDGRIMAMLHQQYTHNHLYVYPEHRDYDPGHNNLGGGYGDVYPANTPYVLISQGSSGSDRSFLDAVACTMAAFRPEVKKALVDHGMLMPTVQMILRWCYDDVHDAADYLTGKAHPTVFDGSRLHRRAMIDLAHAITPGDIPPMVRLAVVEETLDLPGKDYFEGGPAQRLATTPQAIVRVHRTLNREYQMTVSAAASSDVNRRPLTYHWAVLRGDADAITIKPLNADGSLVRITVPWHERRPIAPGSEMASTRVDIGAFVDNGAHYSAPAFISISTLDDESRVYDPAGHLIEVDYAARTTDLRVTDWPGLLRQIAEPTEPGPRLLHDQISAQQRQELAAIADEYILKKNAFEQARKTYDQAQKAHNDARAAARKLQQDTSEGDRREALDAARATEAAASEQRNQATAARDNAQTACQRLLNEPRASLGGSVEATITPLLKAMLEHPTLVLDLSETIDVLMQDPARKTDAANVRSARDRLLEIGLINPEPPIHLVSIRAGEAPIQQRLTPYEQSQIQRLNSVILNSLLFKDLVDVRFVPNYVDPMIATHRTWRDAYHYTVQGELAGWTRYPDRGPIQRFTPDGARVLTTDRQGRPVTAREVRYELAPMSKPGRRILVQRDGPAVFHYAYDDDQSPIGRIVSRDISP